MDPSLSPPTAGTPPSAPVPVREGLPAARLGRKTLGEHPGISDGDVARYGDGAAAAPGAQPARRGVAANDTPDLSLSIDELAGLLAGVQRPAVQLAIVRLLQTLGSSRAAAAPSATPAPSRARPGGAARSSGDDAAMAALRQDVARRAGRVGLRFRPLVNARTAALVGFEGLASWRRTDGTSTDDATTRLLAARGGFAEQLDFPLLQEAAYHAAEWSGLAPTTLVTIAVSPAFLADSLARRALGAVLRASGARPEALGLVVEPAMLSDAPRLAILHGAAELGLRLCMDGFGPEHLPLLAASRLPLHLARLAPALRPEDEAADASLPRCQELIRALHARGVLAMAGGANSAGDAAFWLRAGVDVIAGSWYSEALSPLAAAGMLQSNDNLPWSGGPPTLPEQRP